VIVSILFGNTFQKWVSIGQEGKFSSRNAICYGNLFIEVLNNINMPISPDEFKKGETLNSWEEIIYELLGDGNAYSLTELENELGIVEPKTDNQEEIISYILKERSLVLTLIIMKLDGRLVSKQISVKNGKTDTYYMRKEFLK